MKRDIEIPEESIKQILSINGLAQLRSVREINTGLTNPIFVINEQYVLRVDTAKSEKDANKFEKEAFLYSLLAKHNLPVPIFFSFDNSKKVIDYEFLLLSYIEGETLANSFKMQKPEAQKSLSLQLGVIARTLHSINLSEFAEGEKLLRKKKSWQETVIEEHREYFSLITQKGYLSPDIEKSISTIFAQFCRLNLPKEQERLVHGDFSPSNFQVKNGKIVGMFDFEFATLGDPFYDLQKIPLHLGLGDQFDITLFLKGYGTKEFSTEENIRFLMYGVNQGLWEIWATETQRFPFGEKHILEGKELIRKTLDFGEAK